MNAFYPLRRPKTIFSFVFVLLVIASVAALALQQHEPFYEGKRLSVWLEELDLANNLFDHAKRQKAVNAVRATRLASVGTTPGEVERWTL